jgi:hypothetical protein
MNDGATKGRIAAVYIVSIGWLVETLYALTRRYIEDGFELAGKPLTVVYLFLSLAIWGYGLACCILSFEECTNDDNASYFNLVHNHTNLSADMLATTETLWGLVWLACGKHEALWPTVVSLVLCILGLASSAVSLAESHPGKGGVVYGDAGFGIAWFALSTLFREGVFDIWVWLWKKIRKN